MPAETDANTRSIELRNAHFVVQKTLSTHSNLIQFIDQPDIKAKILGVQCHWLFYEVSVFNRLLSSVLNFIPLDVHA
jgi:hypothetical protein